MAVIDIMRAYDPNQADAIRKAAKEQLQRKVNPMAEEVQQQMAPQPETMSQPNMPEPQMPETGGEIE